MACQAGRPGVGPPPCVRARGTSESAPYLRPHRIPCPAAFLALAAPPHPVPTPPPEVELAAGHARFAGVEPYWSKPRSPQASSHRDKPVPLLPVARDAPKHHRRVKPPPAAVEVRRWPPCCPSPPEVSTPMDSSRFPLPFPNLGRACSCSNRRRRRWPVLHDLLCEFCPEVGEDMAVLHITP
jgi:hypothetical protein